MLGILIPMAVHFLKPTNAQEAAINSLYWQVPGLFFLLLFAIMLLYVPFSKYQELEIEAADAKKEIDKLKSDKTEAAKALQFEINQRNNFTESWKLGKNEIAALTIERDALRSELIELKKPDLYFEVDWPRCHVRAIVDSRFDRVAIESNLKLRFCKRGPLSVMGKKLEIDLYEMTESGDARRINSRGDGVRFRTGLLMDKDVVFVGLEFTKPMSPDYDLFERIVVYDSINSLSDLVNKKHFLRFTVEASNQEPFSVDFDVDWTHYGRLIGPR